MEDDVPGCKARCKISSTDSTSLSGGACRTIMTDPIRHIAQPILPSSPSCSSRKYEPRTAPMRTESAPSGVTRMAGANAYAAKLNISPSTTVSRQPRHMPARTGLRSLVIMPAHHVGFCRYPKPSPLKPCFSMDALRPCKPRVSPYVRPEREWW